MLFCVHNFEFSSLFWHYPSQEFVSECVLSHVCEAGFCSNQASVKYLIEWTLILVLHQNPSHIQNLWNCFSLVSNRNLKTDAAYMEQNQSWTSLINTNYVDMSDIFL